jgi:hypothetical protein
MLRVIGNDILFGSEVVGKLNSDNRATLREAIIHAMDFGPGDYDEAFNRGHAEGEGDADEEVRQSYEDGRDVGYDEGFLDGGAEERRLHDDEDFGVGWDEGYEEGFADGFDLGCGGE